jgi:S-adenosylmethionine-dependent methyltransferase
MSDDIQDIHDYYNQAADSEENRLDRHQLERDLTRRYFADYLPPSGKLLEIGAASGGHTLWLAEHGWQVVAVDLSEVQLARLQRRVEEVGLSHQVDCCSGDARRLESVPESDFDAVLLMGPLYHLVQEADRRQAVQQAVSRLKPGGIMISSFISRFGILGDLLKNVSDWIEDEAEVRSIIEHGYDPPGFHKGGFRGYFVSLSEIAPLHEAASLHTLLVAGVEPAISADDESYNRLEDRQRQLWLDLLYQVSREPNLVASSRHILYIGRKPGVD